MLADDARDRRQPSGSRSSASAESCSGAHHRTAGSSHAACQSHTAEGRGGRIRSPGPTPTSDGWGPDRAGWTTRGVASLLTAAHRACSAHSLTCSRGTGGRNTRRCSPRRLPPRPACFEPQRASPTVRIPGRLVSNMLGGRPHPWLILVPSLVAFVSAGIAGIQAGGPLRWRLLSVSTLALGLLSIAAMMQGGGEARPQARNAGSAFASSVLLLVNRATAGWRRITTDDSR